MRSHHKVLSLHEICIGPRLQQNLLHYHFHKTQHSGFYLGYDTCLRWLTQLVEVVRALVIYKLVPGIEGKNHPELEGDIF